MSEQYYPLPKKMIEYNKLVRIINFDSTIDGFFFLQTNIKDDLDLGIHKITAYRQDVADDRTKVWKKSKAVKIKMKDERKILVRKGLYFKFSTGLSDELPFAMILPEKPSNLKIGILQNEAWSNAFSQLITTSVSSGNIISNLENSISRQSEHMARAETSVEREKVIHDFSVVANKINSLANKDQQQNQQKATTS